MVHYLLNLKKKQKKQNLSLGQYAQEMTKPNLKLESLVPNTKVFPLIKPPSFPDSHLTRAYRLFTAVHAPGNILESMTQTDNSRIQDLCDLRDIASLHFLSGASIFSTANGLIIVHTLPRVFKWLK